MENCREISGNSLLRISGKYKEENVCSFTENDLFFIDLLISFFSVISIVNEGKRKILKNGIE